jgi:hypothetical protein
VRRDGSFGDLIFCHPQSAIDHRAGAYAQDWSMDIAANTTARENFDAAGRFNAAEELPMDFDFSYLDVGVHDGMFANHKRIIRRNRTLKIPVDAKASGEFEFAGYIGALVQESRYLIGLLETKFHVESLSVWPAKRGLVA